MVLRYSTLLLICMCAISLSLHAQLRYQVSGNLQDMSGRRLPHISLRLVQGDMSLHTLTDTSGRYVFAGIHAAPFFVQVWQADSAIVTKHFAIPEAADTLFKLPPIILSLLVHELQELLVKPQPIILKQDTIQYNASGYPVPQGALVEDMLKKLPGLTIDKDGNVTVGGKVLSSVRINGKDFFGGEVQTATQNLPADIVSNIQIIDDYGEQANMTGIKSGESQKVLNITIRKDKSNGRFGQASLGAGSEQRYFARLMAHSFNGAQQLSLLGSLNNTNLNINAQNAGPGAGVGQGNGNGLTSSRSAGFNYRSNWGKSWSANGSYGYTQREHTTDEASVQLDIDPLNTRNTSRITNSRNTTKNQKLSWNMDYRPDASNLLKLVGRGAINSTDAGTAGSAAIRSPRFATSYAGTSATAGNTYEAGASLYFNHRFDRKQRNLNLNAGWDFMQGAQQRQLYNTIISTDSLLIDSNSLTAINSDIQHQNLADMQWMQRQTLNVSYTEPLAEGLLAEISYAYSNTRNSNERDVYDIDSGTGQAILNGVLSNQYASSFIVHKYGLNLQSGSKRWSWLAGIMLQPALLKSTSDGAAAATSYESRIWTPNARIVYRPRPNSMLSLNCSGNTKDPDLQQLQPVVDSSNPNNIVVGNPALRPEYSNRLNLSYNSLQRETGQVLTLNLFWDQSWDKIVVSTVNDPQGTSRTTSFLNTQGFYNCSGNGSYTMPLASRKLSLSLSSAASYSNNISYVDHSRNNGSNLSFRSGMGLRLDLPELLDLNVTASYALNKTDTRFSDRLSSLQTQSVLLVAGARYSIRKDLRFGCDYSGIWNDGYARATAASPHVLSLQLEYLFWKHRAATLRFQAFDLLNQNVNVSRTSNGSSITDTRYNGLQRYFLLSFQLRLSAFG
jgi:hypothetical protein